MRNPFSFSAMARGVRASDTFNFGVDLKADRVALVQAAVDAANATISPLALFKTTSIKQRMCAYYDEYSTVLILRAMCAYLIKRFRLSLPNRDRVVKSVIESMADSTPFYIIRRDFSSFYENLPTSEIRNRLLYDTAIPRQLRHHLRTFFAAHCPNETHGLPRGVGLSAVLVELAMQEFDASVRDAPGVYRYFRYSDDVLIFTFKSPDVVVRSLDALVMKPLAFNKKKSDAKSFSPNDALGPNANIDYLGYRFSAPTTAGSDKPRTVDVSISPSKIDRLKTRIILSLKDYAKNGNSHLLLRRMRYLSGNHKISRTPGFYQTEKKHVRIGIYFNYKHCGKYVKRVHEETDRIELKSLDGFYHGICFGGNSPHATTLRAQLPALHSAALKRISFNKGYSRRVSARVAAGTIRQMKAAWRNH